MKFLTWIISALFCSFSGNVFSGEPAKKQVFVPTIDGEWWDIASTPDLGKFNAKGQEPVDFGIWQAADGTWQAWSCIRNVNCGGHARLFYRWEGKNPTDRDWTPMGIAMMSEPDLGEPEGGLQAPFVLKEGNTYYMFYGDWDRICLAKSDDGKHFERVLNPNGQPDLFRGPYQNTRDAMVLKSNGLFFCYYTAHTSTPPPGKDSCAVFCRTSTDLYQWSAPLIVCSGGSPSKGIAWYGADSECPFVVNYNQSFYLFRNQLYGPGGLNTQYVSDNPLSFGIGDDNCLIQQLNVSAPEIIESNGEYYIAALKPNLDGIRMAKLKWQSQISQPDACGKMMESLFSIAQLPEYCEGDDYQLSSYDPTGGNDDGFSGKYSYIRKEGNNKVIADIQGAGMITRIWTPTPSEDTIRFYFDGKKQPEIALPFVELFSGNVFPFVEPLCGYEAGGYYCYLPIAFKKSLKIVYQGDGLKFHQIQYRKFRKGEIPESFTFEYFNKNKAFFDRLTSVFGSKLSVYDCYRDIKMQKIHTSLTSGEEKTLFETCQGGRIVGIELNNGNNWAETIRRLRLIVRWDDEDKKAIDVPAHDFFGYAGGNPSMRSVLAGADASMCYFRLPMPFDSSVKISLKLETVKEEKTEETFISGTVYYTETPRNKAKEGKLYVQSRREYLPEKGKPYRIADIQGKGHYVGTILAAQGLEEGTTSFWEGDDCSMVDGEMRMHGTGSEDYFNGGWYAVLDRWDRDISLPLHGSLLYDLRRCKTGGYRWLVSDKINFASSYLLTMEHGPEKNDVAVDYASLAFFYADRPQFENEYKTEGKIPIKRRDILTAQDFRLKLYWYASAAFGENTMHISSQKVDSWMTNIDFEAVPVAQIDLSGLDKGHYKLHVIYNGQNGGKAFAIWQRTKPVSGWIETNRPEKQITSYAGEIEISEQVRTITLRRKKIDDLSVEIQSFILEKTEEIQ